MELLIAAGPVSPVSVPPGAVISGSGTTSVLFWPACEASADLYPAVLVAELHKQSANGLTGPTTAAARWEWADKLDPIN